MTRLARLEQLLRTHFPEAEFEIFNDSADHVGHAHGGAGVAGAMEGGRQPTPHGGAGVAGATEGGRQPTPHGGAGVAGATGETHYRLRIRDAAFRSQPVVKIHRAILAAIKPETDAGLHSFVIEKAEAR